MPTRLLVRLQMRKSAAAGVAAMGAMVASPKHSRPGPTRAGKPTRDMAARWRIGKVAPRVICSLCHCSELERFPVMLNHFSRVTVRLAVTSLDPGPYLVLALSQQDVDAGEDGVPLRGRESGEVFRSNRNAF